jgi:hypothetical protein
VQTTIIKHHSPAEIRGYVHEAEAMLTEAGYDDDERLALLPTIIGLLAARTIQIAQPQAVSLPAGLLGGNVRGQ